MLFLIHWKSFEFSTWLTREMFIWLKNSTLGISNSEDFHYLHWRLVADYPGHVTIFFRTQCQRPVHPKDLICDIWHSIKIKYPYTKPQSPTPFNSNSHPSHFCTKLWSKTFWQNQTGDYGFPFHPSVSRSVHSVFYTSLSWFEILPWKG